MKTLILIILSLFVIGCVETTSNGSNSKVVDNENEVSEAKESAKLTGQSSKFNPLIKYDLDVEINIEEGTSEVEFEKSFKLETTDKEEIIKESARILRLEENTVRNIIDFDVKGEEREENEDDENEGDTSIEVTSYKDEAYSTIEFNREVTLNTVDKDQIINEIKNKFNLAEEVIQHSIEFEDD